MPDCRASPNPPAAADSDRRRHAELAAIVEDSDDAIIGKDLDGTITSWNRGAERLFGYTAAEAVGRSIWIIVPPDREAEERSILHRLQAGERVAHFETVRRRKDGAPVEVSLSISPIRDPAGKVVGSAKIARDIGAVRRAQRELEDARVRLAEANAGLEQRIRDRTAELTETNAQLESLVYSIAHDLRAPLRSMQAFSKLLLEEHARRLGESGCDYARRIARAAENMDRLVLDLLEYGKAAKAHLELGPVDVAAAWAGAKEQNEHAIRTRSACVESDEPLPSVRAHGATLGQVLANLINNALKFSRPGLRPQIRLHAENRGERVRLWVEDNGIGIAPEHQERIFRVFERLNPGMHPGTGIGLAIVRKGVERMGGQVGVESAPGRGSRFWVELPGT